MIHRSHGDRRGFLLAVTAGLLALMPATTSLAASWRQPALRTRLAEAGASLAWDLDLPLKSITSIHSARLLEEYLYVTGSDGVVRAIRADRGHMAWMRRLHPAETTPWPPTAARFSGYVAVVFTRMDEVLFLDPATGWPAQRSFEGPDELPKIEEMKTLPLATVSLAPAVASEDYVFVTSPDRRICRYDLADGVLSWQMRTPGVRQLAPLYVAAHNVVVVADDTGAIAGLSGTTQNKRFDAQLKGRPVGWLAADHEAVYVATAGPRLYGINPQTGSITLEYRLPSIPIAGPVVTEDSVYVAVSGHGVQRVGKEPVYPNWVAPGAEQFLARWPDRVAMLTGDGELMLVRPETGETVTRVDLGGRFQAVPNERCDAAIVVSERGEIRCLRPAGAPALLAAHFRPPPVAELEPIVVGAKDDDETDGGDEGADEDEDDRDEVAAANGGTASDDDLDEDEPEATADAADTLGLTLEERLIANPLRTRNSDR